MVRSHFMPARFMPTLRSATLRRIAMITAILVAAVSLSETAEAGRGRGRSRGPSPQQIQKMKEEMAYRQQEYTRVQTEVAAKEREIFQQFDENGDGRLFGAERSKYDKHMYEIRSGKAPNPLATIAPLGSGPRPQKKK
jgi:hypothetical protein